LDAWKFVPSMLYCKPELPLAVTVMPPLFAHADAFEADALTVILTLLHGSAGEEGSSLLLHENISSPEMTETYMAVLND
jgi:hypothetical protein